MSVKTECDSLTFIWHCENAFDIQPVLRGKQNEFDSCQSRNEFDLEETNLIIDAGYRNLGWLTTTHLKYYPLKSCSNMGRVSSILQSTFASDESGIAFDP